MKQITSVNVDTIKNEQLKKDAMHYVNMYNAFLQDIEASGIKVADYTKETEKRDELVEKLKQTNAVFRNDGKSVCLNENVSPSCLDCRTGVGSSTYILTLACNRDCFFCTNKNQIDYEKKQKEVANVVAEFKRDHGRYKGMKSAALTGGEPLLHVDECCNFIKKVKKTSKNTQTRIYTNGDLATPEVLQKLADAGLDEIRFGVKVEEDGTYSDTIIATIAEAQKHIPRTMVEMPVYPGTLEATKQLMLELDKIGIFGVNILEFLYPWQHAKDYADKGYEVSSRPYKVLFDYSYAGGLPIAGSQNDCLELLLFCAENNVSMGVHYCSLENKLTAQIYQHNANLKLSGTEHFSENDFFIKIARAYGEDVEVAKKALDDANCQHYSYNPSVGYIEFSPKDIEHLKELDIEIGISYLALDIDFEGRHVLRELQIDTLNSKEFDIRAI